MQAHASRSDQLWYVRVCVLFIWVKMGRGTFRCPEMKFGIFSPFSHLRRWVRVHKKYSSSWAFKACDLTESIPPCLVKDLLAYKLKDFTQRRRNSRIMVAILPVKFLQSRQFVELVERPLALFRILLRNLLVFFLSCFKYDNVGHITLYSQHYANW